MGALGMRLRQLAGWLAGFFRKLAGEGPKVWDLSFGSDAITAVVRLQLDRVRSLRLTLWEAAEFRRRTNVSLFRDGVSLLDLEEDVFLELLTVCALREDPSVTPEMISPHISGERLTEAVAAIAILLGEFMPPMPEGDQVNPRTASALNRLMNGSTGPSPQRRSGSTKRRTGA